MRIEWKLRKRLNIVYQLMKLWRLFKDQIFQHDEQYLIEKILKKFIEDEKDLLLYVEKLILKFMKIVTL